VQTGQAFWFTGLPGSGKTTLARAVKEAYPELVYLSMDELRKVATAHPTYSEDEREHLYMSLVYAAYAFTREGNSVIIDATANRRRWRDAARRLITGFHEIFVSCTLDVCMEREAARKAGTAPTGIYEKAKTGWPVPGVGVEYEQPENPELTIDTEALSEGEAVNMAAAYVGERL